MYIEYKGGELTGPARIGRIAFSNYRGKTFSSGKGLGFKANSGNDQDARTKATLDTICSAVLFLDPRELP